ncbi:MAG: hypothetical protein WA584_23310 [Pyrinomonadaceae bacterium]
MVKEKKLSNFEKKYFKKIFGELQQSASVVQDAQNALAAAETDFNEKKSFISGFMKEKQLKYNLPDNTQITPEGELVLPEEKSIKISPP